MKKHLIVIGTTVLLLVVGLSGCNEISNPLSSNDDNRFVGTWKSEEYATIIFFSDGEGSQSSLSFQWEIKDAKLTVVSEIGGVSVSEVYDYQFSDNDTLLTLTDVSGGTPLIYTKQ